LGIAAFLVLLQFLGSKPIRRAPTDLSPQPVARAVDLPPITNPFGTAAKLPKELTKESFWKMIAAFSEPDGFFMYDNYVSNERSYQDPIPSLKSVVKPGGVYLGVGPEQNFTYIAAVRPAMAFIIDIRRQNMLELLMYKALFQLAADRAEFVSLLFSRKAPAVLNESATADELFGAYAGVQPDTSLFERNLESITSQLSLSSQDKKTIEDIYQVFFSIGPDLNYASITPYAPSGPSYRSLMTLSDADGRNWSYLASEENFRFVKEMQRKNLIVPVVGDFAGSKAIRTVAKYLIDHEAKVSAFYLSNVEMYILPSLQWKSFCANVSALPMDESSTFVRFLLGRYARTTSQQSFGPRNISVISPMIDVLTGTTKGYPPSYYDLIRASK
jgi:hypothetical protein